MNGLSSDAQSLLQRVRGAHEPSRDAREQVRTALAARLAAGMALSSSAAAAGGSTSATSFTLLGLGKALLSGFALGSLGMGVLTLTSQGDTQRASSVALLEASSRPAPASEAPALVEVSPPAREADASARRALGSAPASEASPRVRGSVGVDRLPAAMPAPTEAIAAPGSVGAFTEPTPVASASPSAAPQPSSDGRALAAEARALAEAQRALDQGAPALALDLLSQHQRRFPAGLLGPERAAARIFALCALGRRVEARGESARFLTTAPQSPLAVRVKAACGSSEPSR